MCVGKLVNKFINDDKKGWQAMKYLYGKWKSRDYRHYASDDTRKNVEMSVTVDIQRMDVE